MKQFGALLIDPPWSFEVWSKDTGSGRSATSHYNTMSLDELKRLPVNDLMLPDSTSFVWACWPTLFDAKELGEAWGLEYKTCAFNWIKLNKMRTDKPFTGLGYWTRANSEPCLLFTKGSPKRKSKGVGQVVLDWVGGMFETETIATPIQRHSQKPDCVYQRIEDLVDGPYLELFARQKRKGWTSWGNEVVSDIELEVKA